jgi:hypothetical protein
MTQKKRINAKKAMIMRYRMNASSRSFEDRRSVGLLTSKSVHKVYHNVVILLSGRQTFESFRE